ncbi:M20 family metallo-hydrolase [Flavisolibacter nicotianae]|uniref:M20 family metallo-hydrolase n=1 Tax=Flavisolibacter nicotianae TaxID=2364882 RepID=UPI000EB21898|nr:M20 family metallo-hydrolase [Flavisolibacter nicotianae]
MPEQALSVIKSQEPLHQEAVNVLSELVRLPSFSKDEWQTASYLTKFLFDKGVEVTRVGNNVLALNKHFDAAKPTILLNSHHDTVKPNSAYTRDPFSPQIEDGKLYGLGSNDAGGCLVSLLMTFLHFFPEENMPYNLAYAATAEEEISGVNGIQNALQYLPKIDCAIVGEPTLLQMAVAERGLLVLDAKAIGKAGHAARNEGVNAIYKAMMDIEWFYCYQFEKVSELLGPVKMTVTSIETDNKAHNVVPAECRFLVDVRVNELYSPEEVIGLIQENVQSEVKARSTRLRSSMIALDHPLVKAGLAMGKTYYGSPTSSDKALMPFPALKMGPGDSARSHTADEFIYVDEIRQGISDYIQLLNQLLR